MKVIDGKLLEAPNDCYLLLLGSIRKGNMYIVITISEQNWCNHQLRNLKNGDMPGEVNGVEFAIGENGQELRFNPADNFTINDSFGNCWEMKANTIIRKIHQMAFLGGEESKIDIEILYSSFQNSLQ